MSTMSPRVSQSPSVKKDWYLMRVRLKSELKALNLLREFIMQSGCLEKFGSVLVPTHKVREIKHGRKNITEKIFCRGYVFIEMEMNDITSAMVQKTVEVQGVGDGHLKGSPLRPISQDEVDKILSLMRADGPPSESIRFNVGETVRIIRGLFAPLSGSIEEINSERFHVRVSFTFEGQTMSTEVHFKDVEKLSQS
ncbi:transcription termination/antitermination protein NusG [Mycoavidus cysteinexigens]|nr:transcription termination/antitermination protein NusG [Mycoavidus cysteinexigens]